MTKKEILSEKAKLRLKKLKEFNLPEYSISEELMNAISHGIGAVLSIVAIVLLIINSNFEIRSIICVTIYSVSLFVLYIIFKESQNRLLKKQGVTSLLFYGRIGINVNFHNWN